jgi:hypothetical protein
MDARRQQQRDDDGELIAEFDGRSASPGSPRSPSVLLRRKIIEVVARLHRGFRHVHCDWRKKRTISRLAFGPLGSVYDPAELPPDQAWPAP